MSADDNWLCPMQPFGHQWTDKLNCELCGAERSAADAIVSVLGSARGWDGADAERVRDAHRAEVRTDVLNEAIQSLHEVWRLAPESSRADGINFAIGALMSVRDHPRATVPAATAADVQPAAVEFGVRTPSGVLTPTHDRAEAEQRLARSQYPDAVLVQRTVRYGPWIEVPR